MAMKYLGDTFDIHTGGVDHITVHHTNEIAQSEAATGKEFVHTWMHGEHLIIGSGEKMAKSGENFLTLQTLINKGHDPLAYRYLLLTTHYRKKLQFSWKALDAAGTALRNARELLHAAQGEKEKALPKTVQKEFLAAINTDLNIPKALAFFWGILRSPRPSSVKIAAAKAFDRVFAVDLLRHEEEPAQKHVRILVDQREEERKNKNWKKADALRISIEEEGWGVEDTAHGPHLKRT